MNILPINDLTIDMITELNNGVRPQLCKDTFFIWHKDEPSEIVSGYRIRRVETARKSMTMFYVKA